MKATTEQILALRSALSALERCDLIDRVMEKVYEETEAWGGGLGIGTDLAYLAWTISQHDRKATVQWDKGSTTLRLFRKHFSDADLVWDFIETI